MKIFSVKGAKLIIRALGVQRVPREVVKRSYGDFFLQMGIRNKIGKKSQEVSDMNTIGENIRMG